MKKLLAALFAFAFTVLPVPGVRAASANGDISPAIGVLRRATVMNKCALLGETVNFTRNDYESAVGVDIRYITVMTLPKESDGSLMLNGIKVISGQNVAAGSLDVMTFVPNGGGVKESDFIFRACADGWETTDITCRMVFSEKRNLPPSIVPEGISVFKNAACEFCVNGFDPDGDALEYVIDGYPVNGTLSVRGGKMTYTPRHNYTGEDSLALHAVDEYGGHSESVSLTIKVEDSGLSFADMELSPLHTQAIALAARNAIDYTQKNGKYYFDPLGKVTRIDFTVMLLAARGVAADVPASALPFADADKISAGRRAYLAKAVSLGVAESASYFRPAETVTCAEAAAFAEKLLGEQRTAGAEIALAELTHKGAAPLTREDAARILYCIMSKSPK